MSLSRSRLAAGILAATVLLAAPGCARQAQAVSPLTKLGVILDRGAVGTWDATIVESPAVFSDPRSRRFAMVYTGYGFTAGVERGQVGLAYSDDLIHWAKSGSHPIFSYSGTAGAPDRSSVTGPVMWVEAGTYYLFYIGCTAAGYESGTKTLMLATSRDLKTWIRRGAIISPSGSGWRAGAVYHPSIVKRTGVYYLFFNAASVTGVESIGYATSKDLLAWTVDDKNSPLITHGRAGSWDSRFVGDPSVYRYGTTWQMAYYGYDGSIAQDGLATVNDDEFPLGWTKHPKPVLTVGPRGSYDELYAHKPFIFDAFGQQFHYYTAVMVGDTHRRIALAVSRS